MASSSLSTLCTSSSASLHPSPRFSHSIADKLTPIPNVSVQFLGKRQSTLLLSSTPRFLTVIAMVPPKPGGKEPGGKAKKVVGIVKLALEAGKATPAPPVGPALGLKGVNIMGFCRDYNARTADKAGYIIPVEITVYDRFDKLNEIIAYLQSYTDQTMKLASVKDRSFTFILKTPPTSILLLKAAGVEKASKHPKQEKVGTVTIDQLRRIAIKKLPDLNCITLLSAMRTIAGTAANMGIDIDPPLEPKKNRKKREEMTWRKIWKILD